MRLKKHFLPLSEMERVHELQRSVMQRYLYKLSKGEIPADRYVEVMRQVDRSELSIATATFDGFDEFERFMRANFPELEFHVSHERLHYDCALKHALKDTKLGVYIAVDWESQDRRPFVVPVTITYVGSNFSGWTREQILGFEKESYSSVAGDEWASDSDREIYGMLKNMSE